MYEPRDEISLRELYLIFRAGFLAIVLAALVAGAAAFLYLSTKPVLYEATATVQINVPVPNTTTEEAAWLLTPAGLDWNSYQALAFRPRVLGPAFGLNEADAEALLEIRERLELEEINPAAQARGLLTVTHIATAPTAEEAAAAANDWAGTAVSVATEIMSETVNTNAEASLREIAQREADLRRAREELTAFAQEDDRAVLTSLLNVEQQLQRDALVRQAQLQNLQATARAKRDMLQAVLDSRTGASNQPLAAQLEALVASGALDSATATQLEGSLAQLPASAGSSGQDLMLLVTRTQLESLTSDLAGYVAEQALLTERLGRADAEITRLRTELAQVELAANELDMQLVQAKESFDNVAGLVPLIRLQQSAISSAARVIVPAAPPLEPMPRGRLTITLAAAVVAGLLATLVVFLRAAIREPDPPTERFGINSRQYDIDRTSGNLKRTGEWPAVDPDSPEPG